jgi:hypothetical protein
VVKHFPFHSIIKEATMIILTAEYTSIAIPEECLDLKLLHKIQHVKEVDYNARTFVVKEKSKVTFQFIEDDKILPDTTEVE